MNRAPKGHNHAPAKALEYVRAESFQAVSFYSEEQKRQVIVLYSLGQDGIIREFNGGKWLKFPIHE